MRGAGGASCARRLSQRQEGERADGAIHRPRHPLPRICHPHSQATPRACSEITTRYTSDMTTITEVEKLAFDLPDSQRAVLASHLLHSLPSVLHDQDEGIAEALRRDADFDADPSMGITLDQLDQQIGARRR